MSLANMAASHAGQYWATSHMCQMCPRHVSKLSDIIPKCLGCHPSTSVVLTLKDLAASLISGGVTAGLMMVSWMGNSACHRSHE